MKDETTTRFKAGDEVRMFDSQHEYGTTKVLRVGQAVIVTANGQTWNLDGFWWDGEQSWPFPFIVLPTDEIHQREQA